MAPFYLKTQSLQTVIDLIYRKKLLKEGFCFFFNISVTPDSLGSWIHSSVNMHQVSDSTGWGPQNTHTGTLQSHSVKEPTPQCGINPKQMGSNVS